ncbi:MAG: IS200/IS605 family transposase [Candidatus Altimarinota bacterium]
MKYQKSSHTTYDVRYHLVWITKYRKSVLTEEIQEELRKILNITCEKLGVIIIKLGFESDHVHMYIRIPLNKSISETVGYIKGKSSYVCQAPKKLDTKYLNKKGELGV